MPLQAVARRPRRTRATRPGPFVALLGRLFAQPQRRLHAPDRDQLRRRVASQKMSLGVTEKPDVLDDEDLTTSTPDGRFDVEDALVGELDLAELKARARACSGAASPRRGSEAHGAVDPPRRRAAHRRRPVPTPTWAEARPIACASGCPDDGLPRRRRRSCRRRRVRALQARPGEPAGSKAAQSHIRGLRARRRRTSRAAEIRETRFDGCTLRHVLIEGGRGHDRGACAAATSNPEQRTHRPARRRDDRSAVELVALGPLLARGLDGPRLTGRSWCGRAWVPRRA